MSPPRSFFEAKQAIGQLPDDVGRSERAVLIEIADAGRACWKSYETIAAAACVSRVTVKRAVAELRAKGLVTVEDRVGQSSVLHIEWDRLATYGRPVYVEASLFDQPPVQLDDSADHPEGLSRWISGQNDPGHLEARPGSPCAPPQVTMTHDPGHGDPLTAPRTTISPPQRREEDGIGGVVDSFYRLRRRPLPDARQRSREIELVGKLVDHAGLPVVTAAIERVVTNRRDAIAGREFLAGCQVVLREEIDREQRRRREAEQIAREQAEHARRAGEESARAVVEQAARAVRQRQWEAMDEAERRRRREAMRRSSRIAATASEHVVDFMCVAMLDDEERPPPDEDVERRARKNSSGQRRHGC